ncbi:DUF4384 domain-containing protein [Rosistilla carotiformis]|uniref:DUF4384 domain-containing protein n=1 Tax=Rosistilla carotiformis TaxID=2528017 RepID=UPI0018D2028C|nr:DUF4384 domain-containing protein [Rosistilla carotiformis]
MSTFFGSQFGWTAETVESVSAIQQDAPDFMVNAQVNHGNQDYREGDEFRIRVVSERDAYLYVIYQQSDGSAYQVFPNAGQQNNRVKAKEVVTIPSADDQFRWRIAAPFGTETVKVIASETPIENLSSEQMKSKRFNVVSKDELERVTNKLVNKNAVESQESVPPNAEQPAQVSKTWAETEVKVTTYARNQELAASGAKRFAVYFGVSEYQFSKQAELFTEHNSNLSSPHRDAMILNEMMNHVGDIHESRVFVNEQATRANLESMVTQWLPQKSRPGDTVFIYFSGHGGQIPDDGGDEADKQDELLLPSDFIGLPECLGLLKQAEEGTITPENKALIPALRRIIQGVDSAEVAHHKLARQTGVTDDLFAHWLQSLAGREIVVILDVCHSGGYVTNEKSISDPDAISRNVPNRNHAPMPSDFLDQEVTRLKDIGQSNTCVLTASSTSELSLVRPDGNLSVMTHELIMALQLARGPMEIEQTYGVVAQRCAAFFASEEFKAMQKGNEELIQPHHPLLYKPTQQKVWMKP